MLQNIVLMPALGLEMSEAPGCCCWVKARLGGGGGGGGGGGRVMALLLLPIHCLLSFPVFLFSKCYFCVRFFFFEGGSAPPPPPPALSQSLHG